MKNGKTAGPSRLVSKMVKSADEARIVVIVGLINQIIAEGVILPEWQLSTIVNCYMGKGDAL